MAIKQKQRGFTLLIAVIFMSVMLSFGLALSSLSYKQQVLAASSVESQYAFYAADAGIECALYADQILNTFGYPQTAPGSAPLVTCDGAVAAYPATVPTGIVSYTSGASGKWVVTNRISLDSGTRCVDITLYKPSGTGTNYIFALGYNVSCAVVASPGGARIVSRGITINYSVGS